MVVDRTPDHIALNVPINIGTSLSQLPSSVASSNRRNSGDRSTEEGGSEITNFKKVSPLATTRRSLKRTWNQLPRLQRNLIILGVSATCITLMLLLPGDNLERKKDEVQSNSQAMGPTQEYSSDNLPLLKYNNNHDDVSETIQTSGEKQQQQYLNLNKNKNIISSNPELNKYKSVESRLVKDISKRQDNTLTNVHRAPKQIQSKNGPVDPLNDRVKSAEQFVAEKLAPKETAVNFIEDSRLQFKQLGNLQLVAANNPPNEADTDVEANALYENQGEEVNIYKQWPQDRSAIEKIKQNPLLLPITSTDYEWIKYDDAGIQVPVTIDDCLDRLNIKDLPQKQHFHGVKNFRQEAVVNAFRHSWKGYKKFAWGSDNLKPISESSHDWFGLGLTLIDSLDTMYIMGLDDEFQEAKKWVEESMVFNVQIDVNLFEVTIRVLGGLLSAFHLSGEKIFLKKSIELANRLMPCFLTPSGIPYSDVNLFMMTAHVPKWSPDSSTSEVTTIQLEFRDLSRLTKISLYERVTHRVNQKIHSLHKKNGLVPIFINANTGMFRNYATISLGARGDSYYEYLLKQWIQTGRKSNDFRLDDYIVAVDGILSHLLRRTPKENMAYLGELINGKEFKPKMDHLTCYLPGTLLLGYHFGLTNSHNLLARDLLDTCYQMYGKQPTHLAPEITYFVVADNNEENSGGDMYVKPNDAHNLQRPEFIESLYYFYALTGNKSYQDMGWGIFQAFERYTKVSNGYTSIGNVKNIRNTRPRDMMESFWLAETLKYFYLLFSNNPKEIDLEKWLFNTEAHLLPIRTR